MIPATKGVTLSSALSCILTKKKLNFSQITISDNNFQSSAELCGSTSYCGPVEENTDIGNLIGKMLIVTEKENIFKRTHSMLQKAASVVRDVMNNCLFFIQLN